MAKSNASIQSRDLVIIQGIHKRLQNVQSIVLGGMTYDPTALAALFQSQIDRINTTSSLHGQWIASTLAATALAKTIDNARMGLLELVRQTFSNAPDALADFGFTPRKVTTPDPATQVIASAKRRATRAARHTMGKVQKAAIVGTLPGPVVLDAGVPASGNVSAAAPAAALAPAPEAATAPRVPAEGEAHETVKAPGLG